MAAKGMYSGRVCAMDGDAAKMAAPIINDVIQFRFMLSPPCVFIRRLSNRSRITDRRLLCSVNFKLSNIFFG
jgi:hypothetical protein